MDNSYLIKNAKIVSDQQITEKEILIKDGIISKIDNVISCPNTVAVIDANGTFVLPGLIDDQVHFREPGLEHKATIATESKACLAGGITSFIEQPNTNPQTTTIALLEKKQKLASKSAYCNYSFTLGATNDNLEEIKKLPATSCAGIKMFLGSSTGNMLIDNEQTITDIFNHTNLVVCAHCEDEYTIKKNLEYYKEKYGTDIPIDAHPNIRSEEACYISSSKAVGIAKKTGARLHIFHLSTAKETELFRNDVPLIDKRITAEVCLHHLWFSDKDYKEKGSLIKWNPAVKNKKDRDALWQALIENKIDVIATDHAPHTLKEKSNTYLNCPSGGPLVQHLLLGLFEKHKKRKIPLTTLVEKACHNPAILFQIEKRGYIKEGYFADIVIIDPNGKTPVNKENLLYKCGWSPFEKHTFDSQITHTFVNGHLAYQNGIVNPIPKGQRLTFNRITT